MKLLLSLLVIVYFPYANAVEQDVFAIQGKLRKQTKDFNEAFATFKTFCQGTKRLTQQFNELNDAGSAEATHLREEVSNAEITFQEALDFYNESLSRYNDLRGIKKAKQETLKMARGDFAKNIRSQIASMSKQVAALRPAILQLTRKVNNEKNYLSAKPGDWQADMDQLSALTTEDTEKKAQLSDLKRALVQGLPSRAQLEEEINGITEKIVALTLLVKSGRLGAKNSETELKRKRTHLTYSEHRNNLLSRVNMPRICENLD